jgi:nucleotide-binding universal stress UspA family protein
MDQQACPLVKHEKILVPLDGSENSARALTQAIYLAKSCGSKIYLLTVIYQNPEYFAWVPVFEEKLEKEAKELLERAKREVEKEQVPCELLIRTGEQPYEFIIREAKDKKTDLIIMGSHGRSGLKRMLIGSVAAKVIGHAPCAVMVIPDAAASF